MKSFIKAISYYLPKKVLTNNELISQYPEWDVQKISRITGVYNRHIAEPDETASDMACKAAEKLFAEHDIKKQDIDFIIFVTQSNDYISPSTACTIQDRLNIKKTCGAVDINQGCTGYLYGLSIARGLISSSSAQNILLLTAETTSRYINPGDKSCRTIFGDGASATLVALCDKNDNNSIGDFIFGTDGKGAKNIIIKYGGARFPLNNADLTDRKDKYGNIRNETNFLMNGTAVFNFSVKTVPTLIQQTLDKHNLKLEEIDLFVLHQANKIILDTIRAKMKIKKENFHICIENCGNTVSSTIPIALHDAITKGLINKGKTVMLVAFGVGYSWASCIIKF
jgi:3-oxoacyl-[acyl-carrier-protein] synthase-3